MRVLVCGGREFSDINLPNKKTSLYYLRKQEYDFVLATLEKFAAENSKFADKGENWLPYDIEIISGMAKGVDTAAANWATTRYCKLHPYPADWATHGNKAGPIRNRQMLAEGKPDVVIAFAGGIGTKNMMKQARNAGVPVIEVKYGPNTETLT